ncbi:MAG: hypothetical protein U0531_15445 [Dehalococcoidia bacterium]
MRWPAQIVPAMGAAIALLRRINHAAARVEDTAEITFSFTSFGDEHPERRRGDAPRGPGRSWTRR